MVQSPVGFFPELCLLQVSGGAGSCGIAKATCFDAHTTTLLFPLGPVLLVLKMIIIIIIIIMGIQFSFKLHNLHPEWPHRKGG